MATRSDFVEAARSMLGIPWKHMGTNRIHGVDCIGLAWVAAKIVGLEPDPLPSYTRRDSDGELLRMLSGYGKRINPKDAIPGDLLLFRLDGRPAHVGIYTEKNDAPHVLHSHARLKSVREDPLTHDLKDALMAAYRVSGLED